MSRLKISAISYLNTAPLMWDFEHANPPGAIAVSQPDSARDFEITYTLPSACAEALRAGTADIGIIPAAAYATIPNLVIIPDVAIASRHAVRSILLVSKQPLHEWPTKVHTVALDTSSMTSAALAKIIFAKWRGGPRVYHPMPPNLDAMLAACDAALLIGDPALQVDRGRYATLDLAEEWNAHTGKSFVFAFWAVRQSALEGRNAHAIAEVFRQSRDHGVSPANLEAIAQHWSPRLRLPLEIARSYLTTNIHYYLDAAALEGLNLYYQLAAEIGALPVAPKLNFVEA